jgi:hypothetical protein
MEDRYISGMTPGYLEECLGNLTHTGVRMLFSGSMI